MQTTGPMDDFTASVQKWWAQPFNATGSVTNWFLFLGLIIVIIIAWNHILRFIIEE